MSPYTDFVKKQMAVMGNSIPAKERMTEIAKLWHKQKTGSSMPSVKGAKKKSRTAKKLATKKKSRTASVKSTSKRLPVASKKKTEKM